MLKVPAPPLFLVEKNDEGGGTKHEINDILISIISLYFENNNYILCVFIIKGSRFV